MTLALAALAATSALQAQDVAQTPAYKTAFVKDGKAHWFLEVGTLPLLVWQPTTGMYTSLTE